MRYLLALILGALVTLTILSSAHASPAGLVYPLMGTRVSSDFGLRKHPVLKKMKHHGGIDLAAPHGAPIRAVREGTVVFADPHGGYGKLVVIMHKDGLTTHYGHCDTIDVKTGQRIRAGQVLGTVGSSGRVTGPHLHFEIRKNGEPVDPESLIPDLAAQAEG
jgi:murein DD-endopeptidase MepM/ murein hydrolase activator NlpD